jgi:predicted outer membrane lipoprotein
MTASLSPHAQNGSPALDPGRLAAANINPKTGLASDYLNHFNEAIMLLDLLPTTPECIVELIGWEPLSYEEHFATSHFKDKELALAAYATAEPTARGQLDELGDTMNALLVATCETFQRRASLDAANALAAETAARLKLLVARAGAVINGYDLEHSEEMTTGEQQATVDALFER